MSANANFGATPEIGRGRRIRTTSSHGVTIVTILFGALACNDVAIAPRVPDDLGEATDSEATDSEATDSETTDSDTNTDMCGDGIVSAGEECDDSNQIDTDSCTSACALATCGDGHVWIDHEKCDDGDTDQTNACTTLCLTPACDDELLSGDESDVDCGGGCPGCDLGSGCAEGADCASGSCADSGCVVGPQVAAGAVHTCALLDGGAVRCWGAGGGGRLGYGNQQFIGDDESPASAGDVDVGGPVVQLTLGGHHTCALLDGGTVRCWGLGNWGQLGYGHTNSVGSMWPPSLAGDVEVGGLVIQVVAGRNHTCALLDDGALRCWGWGNSGKLGYGHSDAIGDDESPASAGDVDIGGPVLHLAVGEDHTCALLEGGAVRCWGEGDHGQLGYADILSIGDDEVPASVGDVDVGGVVVQLAAGSGHTCALLEGGAVRCWGRGTDGQLGSGDTESIGDDESPASAGDVNVGGPVSQLAAAGEHTCALLEGGAVRCWGLGTDGQLGYGNTESIGDDESPASAGDVDVGGVVAFVAVGGWHSCALLEDGALRCWGRGFAGQLGYGKTESIGDDESPASAGDVPVL